MAKTKKIFKQMIAGIVMMLCFCMSFSWTFGLISSSDETASAARVLEDDLLNKEDIVPVDEQTLSGMFNPLWLSNAPFDVKSKQLMEGKSITPSSDKFNQTNSQISFGSTPVSFLSSQSLYLWVFIPDSPLTNFYSLSFTLNSALGGNAVWKFEWNDLETLCLNNTGSGSVSYGWKLFELNLSDATENTMNLSSGQLEVSGLFISYSDALGRGENITNYPARSLSIYHIFKANPYSNSSTIIGYSNYVNYKVKENFINRLSGLYIDDTFTLGYSASDIFEYVYVGKQELSNVAINGYTWKIEMVENGIATEYDFGKTITFKRTGNHSLVVKLSEYQSASSREILNYTCPFYIDEFVLGKFVFPEYEINANETKVLVFNVSSGLILDSDIKVSCSDNSIAEITSYENNGKLEISVKGLKRGNVKIKVEVEGHREGGDTLTYSSDVTVRVLNSNVSNFTLIVLWISLGFFSAVLLIIMLISVVKVRKNSVK